MYIPCKHLTTDLNNFFNYKEEAYINNILNDYMKYLFPSIYHRYGQYLLIYSKDSFKLLAISSQSA